MTAAAHASSVTSSMRMAIDAENRVGVRCRVDRNRGGLRGQQRPLGSSGSGPAAGAVQPQLAEELERGRTLHLQASSKADGSPLAGATVWVRAMRGRIHTWEGTTDDQGRYALVLPGQATTQLDVVVAHAGYVTGGMFDGSPMANYTVALERSETIGGTVRDEKGQPIEGARVLRHALQVQPDLARDLRESEQLARHRDDQCPGALAGRCAADEFWPGRHATSLGDTPRSHPNRARTTADKGRAFSIEQVMKTGLSVSGTVLSPFGRPVSGATVVVTMPPWERMFLRLTTDKNGQFQSGRCLDPLRTTPVMTVVASGLAMAAREIVVRPDSPAQVVRLTRRRPIEGRVVDAQGRPVAGAAVSPSQSAFKGMLEWDADTDSDGRFVWYDAPTTDTILLDVSKPNYRPVRERAVDPEAGELTITLHHPQRLHGTVTDAETGRPVEQFTLIHGSGPSLPDMRPVWNREYTRTFSSGQFDLSDALARDDNSRQSILIEADGYQPGEFLGFPGNAEDVVHDFKLRKATTLSGIVRGPDGQPLAGADVGLRDVGSSVQLYYYWLKTPGTSLRPCAPRPTEMAVIPSRSRDRKAWIVAVHKAGFAVRSPEQLAASTEITLVPWGRIEGVIKIGTRIAPSHRVWAGLNGRRFDGVVEHTTRTDQDGRFTIDHVAPGVLTVGRQVPDARGGGQTLSNSVDVEVAPGQTVRVEIGGTGRPVIGRFALPGGAGDDRLGRAVTSACEAGRLCCGCRPASSTSPTSSGLPGGTAFTRRPRGGPTSRATDNSLSPSAPMGPSGSRTCPLAATS